MRKSLWIGYLAILGCGGSGSGSDGGHDSSSAGNPDYAARFDQALADEAARADTATMPDQTMPSDLHLPPDQGVAMDLAAPLDLVQASPDLAGADLTGGGPDMAHGRCVANMGFGGMNQCGESGTCNNMKYAMNCNGQLCTCTIDGNVISSFFQLNTCMSMQNVDDAWAKACMY